jgi:hypothetical protein
MGSIWTIETPNQYFSDQSEPVVMVARSNLAPSQAVSFKNATTLPWSTAVLRVPNASFLTDGMWTDLTALNVKATECGLYLCIKEYTSKVENAQLIETSTEISSKCDENSFQVAFSPEGPLPDSYVYTDVSPHADALYTNTTFFPRTDLSITVPPSNAAAAANDLHIVNAMQEGINTLSHYISTLFDDGTFTNATLDIANSFTKPCSLNGTNVTCGHLQDITGMVIEANVATSSRPSHLYSPPVMEVLWNAGDLSDTFSTLAESITVAMRQPASGGPSVVGKLGTVQTLLKVRWAWISLPLICLVVSAVFLMASILESHRDETPLWKSGGLAYLAHGLDQSTKERVQHRDLSSEIEEASEGIRVRLHRGDDGVLMLRGEGKEMRWSGCR